MPALHLIEQDAPGFWLPALAPALVFAAYLATVARARWVLLHAGYSIQEV